MIVTLSQTTPSGLPAFYLSETPDFKEHMAFFNWAKAHAPDVTFNIRYHPIRFLYNNPSQDPCFLIRDRIYYVEDHFLHRITAEEMFQNFSAPPLKDASFFSLYPLRKAFYLQDPPTLQNICDLDKWLKKHNPCAGIVPRHSIFHIKNPLTENLHHIQTDSYYYFVNNSLHIISHKDLKSLNWTLKENP